MNRANSRPRTVKRWSDFRKWDGSVDSRNESRPRRQQSNPSFRPGIQPVDERFPNDRQRDPPRDKWPDSLWPEDGRAEVKRKVMKPPNFSGKGSVRTFLAKFDKCARYNRWMDREKLHYLTNALEDPATQVLWDLQSDGAMSYRELRATFVRVYGSEEQAEVYRAHLKLVRSKKGGSLTDLAMEIRRLKVTAFSRPTDRTMEIVARDVFLNALDDPELSFQVHTQRSLDFDSAVQTAQYLEAVMHSFPSRPSKPIRAVVQAGDGGKIEAKFKDLQAGQRHLLDVLEQFSKWVDKPPPKQVDSDAR